MKKTRITHEQFYALCNWLLANAEDLHDTKYPDRAAMATAALGFDVTEDKAREASKLTQTEHQNGRINLLYFSMVALLASGGMSMQHAARKGREIVKKARAEKVDDGTPDLFPDAPDLPAFPSEEHAAEFAEKVEGPEVVNLDEDDEPPTCPICDTGWNRSTCNGCGYEAPKDSSDPEPMAEWSADEEIPNMD